MIKKSDERVRRDIYKIVRVRGDIYRRYWKATKILRYETIQWFEEKEREE